MTRLLQVNVTSLCSSWSPANIAPRVEHCSPHVPFLLRNTSTSALMEGTGQSWSRASTDCRRRRCRRVELLYGLNTLWDSLSATPQDQRDELFAHVFNMFAGGAWLLEQSRAQAFSASAYLCIYTFTWTVIEKHSGKTKSIISTTHALVTGNMDR